MCLAEFEASGSQVQLTLERGLPGMLGSLTSKQFPYPSLSFDMIHCARCGIDWDKKGIHNMQCNKHIVRCIYAIRIVSEKHSSYIALSGLLFA